MTKHNKSTSVTSYAEQSTLTVADLLINSVIMSVINLIIFVTVQQQNTITQSLINYFNISKFCINFWKFCMKFRYLILKKIIELLPLDSDFKAKCTKFNFGAPPHTPLGELTALPQTS